MKWDFAIGNPPYQQETENISLTNGQLRSKSVFHFSKIVLVCSASVILTSQAI